MLWKACGPKLTNSPTVIVMVGLPARGKTYISKKLTRYLNWIGVPTKGCGMGKGLRVEQVVLCVCLGVRKWGPSSSNEVGDITVTPASALRVCHICGFLTFLFAFFQVFFIESVCDDPMVVASNIMEVKISSPDYKDCNSAEAMDDFMKRISCYEASYQPLDPDKCDR
ncbi:hypothetical protein PANDA_009136 [Lynx pardinus]|uniref:6-phosphofructo-2-kinase domain-containing protein n=1 Tax=Lynx pardinus TaxID=191816 RepID=A0A485NTY0_LYNPA|nr:hypothetical protein PANDA_009136 [Lynx pardinus]